jgi:hypothetical protein
MFVLVDIGNWGMTDVMREIVPLFIVSWVIFIISVQLIQNTLSVGSEGYPWCDTCQRLVKHISICGVIQRNHPVNEKTGSS